VSALRLETGADIVVLIANVVDVGTESACGYTSGVFTSGGGFQVTGINCGLNTTFAHENGHILQMDHFPTQASGFSAYPDWSYGHQVEGVFHTVMSYGFCADLCPLIPNISNPNVSYLGNPTGIPDQRDNARTAVLTAPVVAGYRVAGPPAIPAAPSVNGSASGTQVSLGFFSNYATSYLIERSLNGTTFTQIGTVDVAVGSPGQFADTNVSTPNTYHYRVRARNFRGVSDYSTIKTLTMPTPPGPPSGLTATPLGANDIRLDWIDGSNNETGFAIEMLINGVYEIVDGADGVNVTSHTFSSLQPSTQYSFRVFFYNEDYESTRSNVATATTLATNPGSISGFAFNDPNKNSVADKGETPAAGLVIFYDKNGNGANDETPPAAITVSADVKYISGTKVPYIAEPNYRLTGLPLGPRRICASFYPTTPGKSFCKTVVIGNGTTQNVNFPVFEGRVGVSSMTPAVQTVREGDKVAFDIEWIDTDGKWTLLKEALIRFASDNDDAIQIRFEEGSRTFSILQPNQKDFGPSYAAGANVELANSSATFFLQDTQVRGTGPEGPSVVLHLVLSFKPKVRGDELKVLLSLTDDTGYVQGFDLLGQVTSLK
jgi:hypothetical protein